MPSRLIAHQILKKQHEKQTSSLLRDNLLPASDPLAENFMQELRAAIKNGNPVAGRFVRPAGAKPVFEQRLERYLATATDAEFISFSRDATKLLEASMRSETAATGGYVVCAQYEHGDEALILVAVLSTKVQPSFDEKLNLISSDTLDFEHLRFAGRIRIAAVAGNEDGVVHFVSRRMEGLSDYFREFLGCEPLTDSSVQGMQLFTSLNKFAEGQKMSAEDRQSIMQQTHSYWNDCRKNDRAMTMTGLANYLRPNDPTVILKHLTEESSGLAGEFSPPPSKIMKRFVKFTFTQPGLKLEFDRNDWLDNITVREKSITIRNAPADLVRQLSEEKSGV